MMGRDIMTYGEYLERFPNGLQTGPALKQIDQTLIYIKSTFKEWQEFIKKNEHNYQTHFRKNIKELQNIVRKVTAPGKASTLDRMEQILKMTDA